MPRQSLLTRARSALSGVSNSSRSSNKQGFGGAGSDYGSGNQQTFWANFVGGMRQNAGVKRSVPQYLDSWNTQPWLRRGGHSKAQSISDIEWLTLVEDPDTEQMTPVDELLSRKHPLQTFFDNPHPIFSWQAISYIWTAHLDLVG